MLGFFVCALEVQHFCVVFASKCQRDASLHALQVVREEELVLGLHAEDLLAKARACVECLDDIVGKLVLTPVLKHLMSYVSSYALFFLSCLYFAFDKHDHC